MKEKSYQVPRTQENATVISNRIRKQCHGMHGHPLRIKQLLQCPLNFLERYQLIPVSSGLRLYLIEKKNL